MVCKGSTCKGGEVLEVSREADRVVTKEVTKEVIKEDIKAVTKEDIKAVTKEVTEVVISEAHRAMATVEFTRATEPMVVTRIRTRTITNNNIPTMNLGEEARAKLCLSGGRGCIAWPNTGRTNSTTLPV